MILPIHIAQKLQEMLATGTPVPSSLMKHTLVQRMLDDAVLIKKQTSKTKAVIAITDGKALNSYLNNNFGIVSLNDYIQKHSDKNITRHEAVAVSGNSKLKAIRTFKGFLVNSYQPINTQLGGKNFIVQPVDGTYTFITNFESFLPDASVTIIGVENAENFRYIHQQAYLFKGLTPMFVSRYPHSNDLLTWLKKIPNPYLHFGDFDFEGIQIYLNEYKKHLNSKASFYLPEGIEKILAKYGNRDLYDRQLAHIKSLPTNAEASINALTQLFHKYKKVLEQEIFVRQPNM